MSRMAREPEPPEGEAPSSDDAPPPPPYAPDPRLIDVMERSRTMTDDEVRRLIQRDTGER